MKGQDTRFTAKSVNCNQLQSILSLAIVRSGKWWLVIVAIECLGTSHVKFGVMHIQSKCRALSRSDAQQLDTAAGCSNKKGRVA
jgi:hypothetical protein